jgi:hypothetical protein
MLGGDFSLDRQRAMRNTQRTRSRWASIAGSPAGGVAPDLLGRGRGRGHQARRLYSVIIRRQSDANCRACLP